MSRQRGKRIARVLIGMAIVAVGFIAVGMLTSGITPTTQAICLAGHCGPNDPPVVCPSGHHYANICLAQAACEYNCCPGPQCHPCEGCEE